MFRAYPLDQNLNSLKVIFLGDSGAGKTTAFNALFYEKSDTQPGPTINGSHTSKVFGKGQTAFEAVIYDTAGKEAYHLLTQASCANADLFFIFIDSSTRMLDDKKAKIAYSVSLSRRQTKLSHYY
jgi:small GTP-binding protein